MEKVEGVTRIGDVTWNQTKSERHFDLLLQERRLKGRQTYGQGLEHTDNYDWNQMALEEAMDLAQYLAAENLRLRESVADRDAASELHQALLTTTPGASDEAADLHIVCVPSGGGVFLGRSDGTWYCSGRKTGWFAGKEGEMFRCDFLTVGRAVNFARSCGWVDE